MSASVVEARPGVDGPDTRPDRPRRRRVLHPFLFAAFPIVFLLARNTAEDVSASDVLVPLAIALTGTAVLLGILNLVLRDLEAAGLATSALLLLFFSFGHLVGFVDPEGYGDATMQLLLAYGLLAAVAVLSAIRFRGRLAPLTGGLNIVAAVLVVINLVPAVPLGSGTPVAASSPIHLEPPDEPRDVYYLIFDRYASPRTLRDLFDYDDEPFLDGLRDRGFYVAEDSVANYPKTAHSLASSLNAELLDGLVDDVGTDSGDWDPIFGRLQDFRVARALRSVGYRYVHLGSWWSPTREDPSADANLTYGSMTEFSSVLLDTTAWPELADVLGITDAASFERTQYDRANFQFRSLARVAEDPRPTFAFAHFTLPHPPYVFAVDGSYRSPEEVARAQGRPYLDQLTYTNRRIEQLVATLLAGPDQTDPIIVIQSDEGPHPDRLNADEDRFDWTRATDAELSEKLRILNAYYLPGEDGSPTPYPTISPVNTFRLIFDRYFGAALPLLPDRTWVFQDNGHPYRLTEVTDRLRA